jgi:hypothetical protein
MPNEDPSQPEELTRSPPELDRENVPHLPAARNTDEQSDGTIVVTCPAMACPADRQNKPWRLHDRNGMSPSWGAD